MPEISQEELDIMLFCSMRYAYGRVTYIVDDVCQLVRRHYEHLRERDQRNLRDDLAREIGRSVQAGKTLGEPYHHGMWIDLLTFMQKFPEALGPIQGL